MKRPVSVVACLIAYALSAPAVFAAQYTFTKITDDAAGSTLGLASFIGPFLINSSGAVAFTAAPIASGQRGVYIGSGNGISTVYVGGLTVGSPRVNWATGFNDSGTVVYVAGAGVYTATAAGMPFQVTDSNGASSILPGIDNAGTVAWGSSNSSILTRTGSGAVQTLVSDTELPRSLAIAAPSLSGLSINNSGTVAFYASGVQTALGNCSCGLFTKGPSSSAAQVSSLLESIASVPQINDGGAIAFAGTYQGAKGVFIASGGKVAAVVDLSSQTVSLDTKNFSLNSSGEVAYYANFILSGVQGIFTGSDKVADRVIATGDPLFGSVVSEVTPPQTPGRFLNDKGQVAFGYKLSNGLAGVAVATPVASTAQLPKIAAGGILNGASFSSDAPAAPGAIVSIFGSNFISQLVVPPGDPLPSTIQGVSVSINGIEAPLFFVAPGQINVQVPYGVTGSTATVQVTTPAGQSNTQTISLAPESPAIFTADQSGAGQAIAVFANTTTIVGPVKTGTDWRPAKAGDTITIYTNGLGAVTPPINDGWNSCDQSTCKPDYSNLTLRNTTVRPVVTIGGVQVPDNQISYSGLTPLFAGLYQINLTIPDGVTPGGNVQVTIQMEKVTSAQNVHIGLQ